MLRRLKELLVCLLNLYSVQFSKTIFFIALKRLPYLITYAFHCQQCFLTFFQVILLEITAFTRNDLHNIIFQSLVFLLLSFLFIFILYFLYYSLF